MKVKNRKKLILLLILVMTFTSMGPAYGEWDGVIPEWWAYRFDLINTRKYQEGTSLSNLVSHLNNKHSTLVTLKISERKKYAGIDKITNDYSLALNKTDSSRYWTQGMGNGKDYQDKGELLIDGRERDYFLPQKHYYEFTYDNGRKDRVPVWIMLEIDRKPENETPKEELEGLWERFIEVYEDLEVLSKDIEGQGQAKKPGDYHPMYKGFIDNIMREANIILNPGWNADPRLEKIQVWTATFYNPKRINPNLKREQVEGLLEACYEAMAYVENNRVEETEILEAEYKGNYGLIDKDKRKVDLYLPEGEKIEREKLKIISPNWTKSKFESGEFEINKSAIYRVEALDAIHEKYVDVKDYGISDQWTINFMEGKSEMKINSIRYTGSNASRAKINIEDNKINIDIPFKVDLKKIALEVYHTGDKLTYIDKSGQEREFINGDEVDVSQPITFKLERKGEERQYELNVSSEASSENMITSFMVEGNQGQIDQEKGEILVRVPYEKDISNLKPNIKTSIGASISPKSNQAQDFSKGPVTYLVKAESGDQREYRVRVGKKDPKDDKDILSFKLGTIEGIIKENTIEIELPAGLDLKRVKPTIEISDFAKISPKSGVEVDFSKKEYKYVVEAQNGSKKDYFIKISQEGSNGDIDFEDKEFYEKLIKLRDNIYERYKKEAQDDWEWMNIGFYEGANNGSLGPIKSFEEIPNRFNIYNKLENLNPNKQTDPDRMVMTLTSMGIDASDLGGIRKNDQLFLIKGQEVTNLVERIYNFNAPIEETTVNDQIFGLIALDMGNYSVPAGARYSRDFMLDYILGHEYGTDGFGIDMVGMLMQSLYPYREDKVYGNRVEEKLEEGLDIMLGHKKAPKVNPMREDFLFDAWGDVNSESTAQAIIALCSIGIDPYSDYRFSKGPDNNMIVNWINRFATNNLDGFGHTNREYNPMGTYQGMYALQWYINFIENGRKPYSLYYDGVPFDFSEEFSQDVEMEYFQLLGKEGLIDHENNLIEVKLPDDISDEDLKNLVPIIRIPKGSSISPEIGQACDFTSPVDYKITAEDGLASKTYKIVLSKESGIASGKKDILAGSIEGIEGTIFKIDHQKQKVIVELPAGTDKSKLKAMKMKFDHNGHSISPDKTSPQDFTKGPVAYVVSAKDGTNRQYQVEVAIKEADPFWFTKFELRGVKGEIDRVNRRINLTLPFGTYLDEVYINKAEFKPDSSTTSVRPGLGQPQNFNENNIISIVPFPIPVTGTIDYSLNIDYVGSSGNAKIESFKVPGVESLIKGNTIELKLPKGMDKYDVEELIPEIKWSGRSIDPEPNSSSNSLKNYYKDYILTDELGNVNKYNIKFVNSDSETDGDPGYKDGDKDKSEMKLESFKINGIEGEIDDLNGRIYIELPYELDLSNLSPIIKTSKETRIYPVSGQALNLNRSARFTLTDGKKLKEYSLVISIAPPKPATKLWDYIDRYNKTEDYQIVY